MPAGTTMVRRAKLPLDKHQTYFRVGQVLNGGLKLRPSGVKCLGGFSFEGMDVQKDIVVSALGAVIIPEQNALQSERLAVLLHALGFFPGQVLWPVPPAAVRACPLHDQTLSTSAGRSGPPLTDLVPFVCWRATSWWLATVVLPHAPRRASSRLSDGR